MTQTSAWINFCHLRGACVRLTFLRSLDSSCSGFFRLLVSDFFRRLTSRCGASTTETELRPTSAPTDVPRGRRTLASSVGTPVQVGRNWPISGRFQSLWLLFLPHLPVSGKFFLVSTSFNVPVGLANNSKRRIRSLSEFVSKLTLNGRRPSLLGLVQQFYSLQSGEILSTRPGTNHEFTLAKAENWKIQGDRWPRTIFLHCRHSPEKCTLFRFVSLACSFAG